MDAGRRASTSTGGAGRWCSRWCRVARGYAAAGTWLRTVTSGDVAPYRGGHGDRGEDDRVAGEQEPTGPLGNTGGAGQAAERLTAGERQPRLEVADELSDQPFDERDPGQGGSDGGGQVADQRAEGDPDGGEGSVAGDAAGEGAPQVVVGQVERAAVRGDGHRGGEDRRDGEHEPEDGTDGGVDGQLGGDHPAAARGGQVGVGDGLVPVLARHRRDPEDEREQRHHTGVGDRVDGRLGLGHVCPARNFTGDADDDQHRSGGEQQPRATDGAQLAELVGDEGGHGRSLSDGWWASVRRRKEASRSPRSSSGPANRSRPWWMITTWSTVWATSLRTWLEIRMVRPSSARSPSRPRSHAMPAGSSPLAGSSSSNTGGSPSRAPARPRRWRPPRGGPPPPPAP